MTTQPDRLDRLAEIVERAEAATPGPWAWFGNTDVHNIYLATKRYGRMFVMGFRRWGMQGARPIFAEDRTWKPNPQSGDDFGSSGHMVNGDELLDETLVEADKIARYEVAPRAMRRDDPRVYRADLTGFRNADATFIAEARADVDWLIAEVRRLRAALVEVRAEHAPDEAEPGRCPRCVRSWGDEETEPAPCATARAVDTALAEPVAAAL